MRLVTAVLIPLFVITTASTVVAAPIHQWSQSFSSSYSDVAQGVATDAMNNIFVTGYYGIGTDVFVAKYDSDGIQQWIRWCGPGMGYDVATDASGSVFVIGALGWYPPATNPLVDIFVKKYSADGVLLWSHTFASASYDEGLSIATDVSGCVAITGRFNGTIDFGGGPLTSAGLDDIIVAKYDGDGAHLWSRRFGSSGSDYGDTIVLDASGGVIVGGSFQKAVDFGGGVLTSAGGFDMFIARYDAAGAHHWSKRFGSSGFTDYACDIALAGDSDFVVAGTFTGTVDFGGGPLTSIGSGDIFIARYGTTGAHQWSRRFGTRYYNQGRSVAVDGAGEIVVTGYFDGTVDFGGGVLTSAGKDDIFLARFHGDGTHDWSARFGDTSYDYGLAVATDSGRNLLAVGVFDGTVDFGGGPLVGLGGEDMYIAKFTGDQALPTLITVFDAKSVGDDVRVQWDAHSDEIIENVLLYRRAEPSPAWAVIADKLGSRARSFVDVNVAPGSTYHYKLVVRTSGGGEFSSYEAVVTIPNAVATLSQNFPNPFNPRTTIEYTMSTRASVAIEIFDGSGALVGRLDQGVRSAGSYSAEWDGRNAANQSVGSGVYFYRLAGVKNAETRKMVLLK